MKLVVLPGDGIGPEITDATLQVLDAAERRFGLGLERESQPVGLAALRASGTTCPQGLLEACRRADGILLGPLDQVAYPPKAQGGINVSGELRIQLDLYANIRPSRSRRGLAHWGRTPMDLVIVRENTEGFYADRNMHLGIGEFMPTSELALSVRKITAHASRRIAEAAFALAGRRRRRVTAVHKANVLKVTEGLFLSEVRAVAKRFPEVQYEEQLVDSMAALLVRDAQRFDVVVTTNMYGDILSDEAAELSGSLGLGAAVNAGERHCMAQAQHGSAPAIAGRDVANPASLILSAAMLLEWLGGRHSREALVHAARAIEGAVDALLEKPEGRTRDLGGSLGTRQFAAAVAAQVLGEARAR
jgi:3-isopropylmalate dehydrogenase